MISTVLAPDTVLQKTPLGVAEIATRKGGLSGRLRPLLILVDGKLTVARLLVKGQVLGLSVEHLQNLVSAGMCEISSPAAPVPSSAAAAGPPPRTVKRSVALARMHLIDQMDRFLGADSEPVRAAIRSAQTRNEVLQVLEQSMDVIREIGGVDRAALVRERVLELLPE